MTMEPMVRCPHCGRYHPATAEYCPEKGLPIYEPRPPEQEKKPNLLWLVIAAVVLILAACILAAIFVIPRFFDNPSAPINQPPISVPTLTLAPLVTRIGATETVPIQMTDTPVVTATATITPTVQPWQACPGAEYLSQLKVGMQAQVALEPPLPNRVRANPDINAAILGYIDPGEKMEILEGPSCDQGWIWWRVRALKDNLTGWTAEGDKDSYWLVPVP